MSILSRLSALEAGLKAVQDQIASGSGDAVAGVQAEVDKLRSDVDAITAEIGTDPPAPPAA